MTTPTPHLVIVTGNDSSLPVVAPPDTLITLIQTPDRATDFQRSAVHRYLEVPHLDAGALTELLRRIHYETPVTALACFLEAGILAAAIAANALGIRSNPLAAVRTAHDKALTRRALEVHGIPQQRWQLCHSLDEVAAFRASLAGAPIIIKPVTGAGSAGVRLIRDDADLASAWHAISGLKWWALQHNPRHAVIAEAVLPGNEFSVEAMSINGRHEVLAVTGKLTTGAPEFVELGHWQPAQLLPPQHHAVVTRTIEVLDAIGHRTGPSHTEVMVNGTDVGLIETHTRFGGDQIWELTQLTTGRHFATETVFALLGLDAPAPGPRHGAASMRKLDWADPERIDDAERLRDVVRVAPPKQHRPEDVTAIADSSDLTGYVLTVGDDVQQAWATAERSCAAAKGDAPVLVMSPAKVVNHFGRERFAAVVPSGSVLITSGPVDVDTSRLADLVVFDEYTTDDRIPIVADELIGVHGLGRVIVLAEADVLRAAEIRGRRGLRGQQPQDALLFRDKALMKRAVRAAGIAVAPHREVRTALELRDATAELGYPCVVKPPHGRGSSGVSVLDDAEALRDFLRTGPFSDQGRTSPWLVEAFQPGEQYRVDGVCRGGRVTFAAAAIYVNTHLDFLGGGYMGSLMLPEQSDEARTVLSVARSVLEKALPAYDGGFHLEVFLTPDGPVFSEVGARIGGGSIPEEVELSYGFNLVEEAILAQLGQPSRRAVAGQRGLAGQLNFSPVPGTLLDAPERFEHPDVVLSEIASPGMSFTSMTHTNAEFARAVFRADSLESGRDTISHLLQHMNATTKWKDSDHVATA
ncbi:ATP-grasp domain-containing protein [Mycolicibacterium arenosum]|uniref:ATP-grasp domain-containing protein n=1 Tax=Mycolicibacterium arenosum TaxID=2952157 RepID=A0ABT1LYI2_9MYCO|nr:ATP-grasp domain-containing protein [Mycolicibacterium sp. CAU 1645]MCP9271954.1 ATP-grasp domain-containing protein [Mycolicibacterium sp. CAU 1645]